MLHPSDMPQKDLAELVRQIQLYAYVEIDGQWDSEKELGADFIGEVANLLVNYGLAPNESDNGKLYNPHP